LSTKIRLGLDELAIIREQFDPFLSKPASAVVGVIETAAACAMLHSFYTEIEKNPEVDCARLGWATAARRLVA
jgi:hypothetical protein